MSGALNFIVYLHGFNSSPDSYKARTLRSFMREQGLDHHLEVPAVPPVPNDAIELLTDRMETLRKKYTVSLVASSLGGFYATWLAERYDCKAVLVNPVVRPHELLEQYLGENINYYSSEHWVLDESHIEQLRALDAERITHPERYLLMLQTGDETLDYRLAKDKYAGCPSIIEQGGNHAFIDFDRHIEYVLSFCGTDVS